MAVDNWGSMLSLFECLGGGWSLERAHTLEVSGLFWGQDEKVVLCLLE